MTFRSILIGLVLGTGLVSYSWFNTNVLHQADLFGNMIPVGVYGLLVLGMLAINPVLHAMGRFRFRAAEWATVVALLLASVVVAGPLLFAHFSQMIVLPRHWQSVNTGWRQSDLVSFAPDVMLAETGASGSEQYNDVVVGLIQGLHTGPRTLGLEEVPWAAWVRPLSFWIPLVALLHIACICLVVIVHKQWAYRERVRYPVAHFASALMAGAEKHPWPDILHQPRFWLGFLPVFCILSINVLASWFQNIITVPLLFDLTAILQKFPGLNQAPDMAWILRPRLVFTVIGFAYFIGTDASFSLGISPIVFSAAFLTMYEMGINPRGQPYLTGGIEGHQRFGAYLAVTAMVLYTGRQHYFSVLSRAFGLRLGDAVEPHLTRAARVGLLAGAGMVVLLWQALGLALPLAILVVFLLLTMFLVIARINVETGLFNINVWWHPVGIGLGLFGFSALGPRQMTILAMLSGMLTIYPVVTMVAMGANAVKIGADRGLAVRKLAPWMMVAATLALVVGVLVMIYTQYNFGIQTTPKRPSSEVFEIVERELNHYAGDTEGWENLRWEYFRPSKDFVWATVAGFVMVLICSILRLRHTWWRLHPILFLVWGTWPLAVLGFSFLTGWFLTRTIQHFGGGAAYERNKPLFLGMVAGEFSVAITFTIWGLIYYAIHGVPGPGFWLYP
jgi:uncharacterized protein DUF6785/uncharacterized protein DUF6784